jgi:hypothetical protein
VTDVLCPVVVGREAELPYRPLTEALLQALRDRPPPGGVDLASWLPADLG